MRGDDRFFRNMPPWWWLFFAVGAGVWAVIIWVVTHFAAKWW